MFGFFRRNPNSRLVDQLNDAIMTQARAPEFYATHGVADTMDGRFEMVALHAALLVRRLNNAPAPGPDIARDLTDAVFTRFEVALRETGVSDIAVPKRMKKLAANYLGRAKAYAEGLEAADETLLTSAIARNIFGVDDGQDQPRELPEAVHLARYTRQAEHSLASTSLEQILDCRFDWPVVSSPAT